MAKTIATVEDFEALANEMDLVPMRFLVTDITDVKGSIRGYPAYTALRMFNEGMAEPVEKFDSTTCSASISPRASLATTT
jgi:hypothetical protein